jgi:hypothetical protein
VVYRKVFGTLWLVGDPTKYEKPVEHTAIPDYRQRRAGKDGKEGQVVTKIKGNEKVLSESDDKGKARELARLCRLDNLIEDFLDENRRYAVVNFESKDTDSREHVLFSIFVKSLD